MADNTPTAVDQNFSESTHEFYSQFKLFHELMRVKVQRILLVSSPYDAFIIEEDGSLASRIINEYHGLNLSRPPRVIRTSSASEALGLLQHQKFDMVITMPHLGEMDAFELGLEIKNIHPNLPVILLAHNPRGIYPLPENQDCSGIDDIFFWSGNSDLLLALVKNTEDKRNVDHDTQLAMVRVLLLVEDNPIYRSTLLPLIYREIVSQIQTVLVDGLNEDHRLLRMRARPKILLAENYEEAVALYQKHREYIFGIISDVRMPRKGKMDPNAGFDFLSRIKSDVQDLPVLMMSSEPSNQERAALIPADYLDKNAQNLPERLHSFFVHHLGFGDFVFRMESGAEIGRASNLSSLEAMINAVPDECLYYHALRNHFATWIMARSEIVLASALRKVDATRFPTPDLLRRYITSSIRRLRKWRQKGVVAQFVDRSFDPEVMDFVKIGGGSLGGKARGLAFMSVLLQENAALHQKYPDIEIRIPRSLVITTEGFNELVLKNNLKYLANGGYSDAEITRAFLQAELPQELREKLQLFLSRARYPLSIRSSSLLEDAQFQPFAGLYETCMIPNNHPDFGVRVNQLLTAVKRVYASTYYEEPLAYARATSAQHQEESMAVVIQELAGKTQGQYFYPDLSGVCQSWNYYPVSDMKPRDGIAHIALGLGRTVVEGEKCLRFCPRYPRMLPQFSTVDEILDNAQRSFYALKTDDYPEELCFDRYGNLDKRNVDEAESEVPVLLLSGTYNAEEHRIRESAYLPGPKVLTFSSILKANSFPLPELLGDLLDLGQKGMGCPVEIEFSVNLTPDQTQKGVFYFLQMRPMAANEERLRIQITKEEKEKAVVYSHQALGSGKISSISDIVFVKPDDFRKDATVEIAEQLGRINAGFDEQQKRYLLIGPGRWGTADRWLGIPVQWRQISNVAAMVELRTKKLHVDSSQGSHFFQNITALGIPYITVTEGNEERCDWDWLQNLHIVNETPFLRHVRTESPLTIKVSSKESECVIVG